MPGVPRYAGAMALGVRGEKKRMYLRGTAAAIPSVIAPVLFVGSSGAPFRWWAIALVIPFGVIQPIVISRQLRRLYSELEDAGGMLCPACGSSLLGLGDEGICPECGKPYSRPDVQKQWRTIIDTRWGVPKRWKKKRAAGP